MYELAQMNEAAALGERKKMHVVDQSLIRERDATQVEEVKASPELKELKAEMKKQRAAEEDATEVKVPQTRPESKESP